MVVCPGPVIRYVDVFVVQSVGPLPLSSTDLEGMEGSDVPTMVDMGKVPVSFVFSVVATLCSCLTVCSDSQTMESTVAGSLGGVVPLHPDSVAPSQTVSSPCLCVCCMCVTDVGSGPADLTLVGPDISDIVAVKPSPLSNCSSVIPDVVASVNRCCMGVFVVSSISPLPLNSTNVECSTGCEVPPFVHIGCGFVFSVSSIVGTLPFSNYICPMCPFPHGTVAGSLDAMVSPHVRSVPLSPRICCPCFSVSCMCVPVVGTGPVDSGPVGCEITDVVAMKSFPLGESKVSPVCIVTMV